MQASQIVNELGIRIINVIRFDVSQSDEYRRRDDRVLEEILTIYLPQTVNYWLDLSQNLVFESDFRDFELIRYQPNCFYKLQMLFFVQAIEIRKTVFISLEKVSPSRLCWTPSMYA